MPIHRHPARLTDIRPGATPTSGPCAETPRHHRSKAPSPEPRARMKIDSRIKDAPSVPDSVLQAEGLEEL